MIKLILIRGLPGSGKSSLAKELACRNYHFESDQYFEMNGEYLFDSTKIADAHRWCLNQVICQVTSLKYHHDTDKSIIVSNTFTQRWEMEPYIQLAHKEKLQLIVADLFDGGCCNKTLLDRNKHGVSLETLDIMRKQYEHDWGCGNPIPPWDRIGV